MPNVTSRRYVIVLAALVGAAAMFVVARYTGRLDGPLRQAGSVERRADMAETTAEKITLRFFRDPLSVPTFTARDLDGRLVSPADWRGKVTIVNFWATWCGPCRAEIPALIAMQEKYRDRLQVIGVSEDEASPELVRRFVADQKINYSIIMTTEEIAHAFPGVTALPTSFVVDREVRVVQKHVGLLNPTLAEQETRALAGLAVNASIEQIDRFQPVKLENAAQATFIPGVDLAGLSADRRVAALQKLNAEPCTCGCDLTVAKCRVDDPNCSISLPLAHRIVQQIVEKR